MREGCNVKMLLRERGKIAPGSLREGHNVFTTFGRRWLNGLISWRYLDLINAIPGPDTPYAGHIYRVRWAAVGSGTQPEIKSALRLVTPLVANVSPSTTYWRTPSLWSFPLNTSVRFNFSFPETDYSGSVKIQEAGLALGQAPALGGAGASIAISSGGMTIVTGLTGLLAPMEEDYLRIVDGAHPGYYRINRIFPPASPDLTATTVEIESALWLSTETGRSWSVSGNTVFGLPGLPLISYKTFEPFVKTPDFALEVQWDLKF